MSAKLLKNLAAGKCVVQNIITGEVCVYWPNGKVLDSLVIPNGAEINLLQYATVAQLRKSINLKQLVNEGKLRVV